LSKKGSIPYITLGMLEKFKIPVPPLPVQEEIVRILDTFTALEAELEAELSARRKQYEFYREQLLTFRLPASSQNAVEGAFSALQTDRQTDRRTE
jgi:restriction endonuclease S subunit